MVTGRKLLFFVIMALLVLALTMDGKQHDLKLLSWSARVVDEKNVGNTIQTVELRYDFVVQNNGPGAIWGLQAHIEAGADLLAVLDHKHLAREFRHNTENETPIHTYAWVDTLQINQDADGYITFALGARTENYPVVEPPPEPDQLAEINNFASDATLVITSYGRERARFYLNDLPDKNSRYLYY